MITPTLHPEWKQLVEVTRDAPYGRSYSHEELAAIMQVKANSTKYYAQIQKWKRRLRKDYQRCVVARHTMGYQILEPNQHPKAMRHLANRAGRRLKEGVEVGLATPTEKLSAEENLRLGNTLAKYGGLLSMFRSVQQQTRPSLPITALPDRPKMLKKP